MGLVFHCTEYDKSKRPHWSYSGFNIFRLELAKLIGMDLMKMKGFSRNSESIQWDAVPYDPIFPLLNHSDCDGELTPEECSEVYPRLRELLSAYPYEYDKWEGMKLADMMEHCAKEGLTLEFV
jgi:hypothetical protein